MDIAGKERRRAFLSRCRRHHVPGPCDAALIEPLFARRYWVRNWENFMLSFWYVIGPKNSLQVFFREKWILQKYHNRRTVFVMILPNLFQDLRFFMSDIRTMSTSPFSPTPAAPCSSCNWNGACAGRAVPRAVFSLVRAAKCAPWSRCAWAWAALAVGLNRWIEIIVFLFSHCLKYGMRYAIPYRTVIQFCQMRKRRF